MKQFFNILILSIAFFLLFWSCKKDNLDAFGLPKLTHEGKGTFACLVNGEKWIAKGAFPIQGVSEYYDIFSGNLNILAARINKEKGIRQLIGVNIDSGLYTLGPYLLYDPVSPRGSYDDLNTNCHLETDSSNLGILNITFLDVR